MTNSYDHFEIRILMSETLLAFQLCLFSDSFKKATVACALTVRRALYEFIC